MQIDHMKPIGKTTCIFVALFCTIATTGGCSSPLPAQTGSASIAASASTAAVAAAAAQQEDQANAERAWAMVMQLVQVKGGFITGDTLERIVGFKLNRKDLSNGYYDTWGGVGAGGKNFTVGGSYEKHPFIPKGMNPLPPDIPETSVNFYMPKNGCIRYERMQNDMLKAGLVLKFQGRTAYSAGVTSEMYVHDSEIVQIEYPNVKQYGKLIPHNPIPKNHCVTRITINTQLTSNN